MYKICIFAGTTEGRKLAEYLKDQPVSLMVCVATEYGEEMILPSDNIRISAKKLPPEELQDLFMKEHFDLVVDATHPYAVSITGNIAAACEKCNTEYVRLLRDSSCISEDAVYVADIEEAVRFLDQTEGNILLTTGSKELGRYRAIHGFTERVYARVLPMDSSLESCKAAGLNPSHIIAMQGPFSREMNEALIHCTSAAYVVSKDSGEAGGFAAKALAAEHSGAKLVVIGRPPQKEGISFADTLKLICQKFNIHKAPQVAVVGIGPGSRQNMTIEALEKIENAECLIGAKRMIQACIREGQQSFEAVAPDRIASYIREHREYQSYAVVMSGDTGFYSGTKKLLPLLGDCDVTLIPGISSLSFLCSRLGLSYEDVFAVSLHGRERDIAADVKRHSKIFALTGGEQGVNDLCRSLIGAGLPDTEIAVGEKLSYPQERIIKGTARELAEEKFDALCAVIIENPELSKISCGNGEKSELSEIKGIVTQGLPDSVFLRGGTQQKVVPMTKSEVRSVCLSKLQLREDSVCWDVGAGTGSVSVEMALQAGCGRVYAIEKREDALQLIEENRKCFGLLNLETVKGNAPDACIGLPSPSHVFIGGSSGNIRDIIKLAVSVNPSVRIVAAAIALESVAQITACMNEMAFEQTESVLLTVARDRKAGPYHLMSGQNPVYIFTMAGCADTGSEKKEPTDLI